MKPSPLFTRELLSRTSHLPQPPAGWSVEAREISRGSCHHQKKLIIIPCWAIRDTREGFLDWYFLHEVAHSKSPSDTVHGREFKIQLRRILPPALFQFELQYKKE